jgi:hypothetical protein
MADIFLSYARADRDRIKTLAKALEEQGWSVWSDARIPPGKKWRDVIDDEISAAKCMVVLWSNASVKSDNVIDEADVGKERKILIPVIIDKGKLNPPIGHRQLHAVSLFDWDGSETFQAFEDLIDAITSIVPPKKPVKSKKAQIQTGLLEKNAEIKPAIELSSETILLPFAVIKIAWKKKSSVFGYDIEDMASEPVIQSYNKGFLELLNIKDDFFSEGEISSAMVVNRLKDYMDKEHIELLEEDQRYVADEIIMRDSIGQPHVPIRFNDKHPLLPNKVYWPLLIAKEIRGDRHHSHVMLIAIVYNPSV